MRRPHLGEGAKRLDARYHSEGATVDATGPGTKVTRTTPTRAWAHPGTYRRGPRPDLARLDAILPVGGGNGHLGGTRRLDAAQTALPPVAPVLVLIFPYERQSAAATEEKVAARLLPTAVTTEMITTEMSAAIRPYSIAVAPVSSRITLERIANMLATPNEELL
jgi:hypothetical protein